VVLCVLKVVVLCFEVVFIEVFLFGCIVLYFVVFIVDVVD